MTVCRSARPGRASPRSFVALGLAAFAAAAVGASPADAWTSDEIDKAVQTLKLNDPDLPDCAVGQHGIRVDTEQHDLNGDGVPELLVYLNGSRICFGRPGGKIHLLVSDGKGGWSADLGFTADFPIIQPRRGGGWADLAFEGERGCQAVWRREGGEYDIWKSCDERGRQVYAEPRRADGRPAQAPKPTSSQTGVQAMLDEALTPMEWVDPASLNDDTSHALPYDHNGSIVLVAPEKGLIVYAEPKRSLRDTVKPGTVLFRGEPWDNQQQDVWIKGHAYVFKKGCPAATYAVRGSYDAFVGVPTFKLEGMSPVRSKSTCSIASWALYGPNTRLEFHAAWD